MSANSEKINLRATCRTLIRILGLSPRIEHRHLRLSQDFHYFAPFFPRLSIRAARQDATASNGAQRIKSNVKVTSQDQHRANRKTTQRLLEFVPDGPPLLEAVLLRFSILSSLGHLVKIQQIPWLTSNACTDPYEPSRYNLCPSSSRLIQKMRSN